MNSQWRAFKRRGQPPSYQGRNATSWQWSCSSDFILISLQWLMDQCLPSSWVPVSHPLPPPTAPQPETNGTDTSVRDTSDSLMANFPIPVNYLSRVKAIQTGSKVPAWAPVFRGERPAFLHALNCEHGSQVASISWTERGASTSSWDATLDSSGHYCVNNVRFSTKLVPPQLLGISPQICARDSQLLGRVSHKFPSFGRCFGILLIVGFFLLLWG